MYGGSKNRETKIKKQQNDFKVLKKSISTNVCMEARLLQDMLAAWRLPTFVWIPSWSPRDPLMDSLLDANGFLKGFEWIP